MSHTPLSQGPCLPSPQSTSLDSSDILLSLVRAAPTKSSEDPHPPPPTTHPYPLMPPVRGKSSNRGNFPSPQDFSNAPNTGTHEGSSQRTIECQQGWILLLRHASRCPCIEGACPIVPYCAGVRRIYQHVLHCSDPYCEETYCGRSKYVLAHYSKCADSVCPICQPIRVDVHSKRVSVH